MHGNKGGRRHSTTHQLALNLQLPALFLHAIGYQADLVRESWQVKNFLITDVKDLDIWFSHPLLLYERFRTANVLDVFC